MRVKTALGELFVDEVGEGPPVVLWHSFLWHGGMWRPQADALQGRHRIVNIDAPGHGRSTPLEAPPTMAACADALVTVLDTLSIERAAVCGLSWGGMVAMHLALRNPARVRALVLMDTSCRSETIVNRVRYAALSSIFRVVGAAPPLMKRIEPIFYADQTLREQRSMVDAWAQYVARMDRKSIVHALACIDARPDVTRALSAVRAPTLVVVGEQDRAQPVAQSRAIAKAIPGAELVVIPRAGHISSLEHPDAVNAAIGPFLERHGG